MQANLAMNPKRSSSGSWAAGGSGTWLIVVLVALVAAAASRDPSTLFAGDVAAHPTATLHGAWPGTEPGAVVDLSLPRASDVRFAPADDEEAAPTF